jgi:beta-glucosidase
VADVELPAAQRDLVDAVVATGTPVVAVIVSGRPLGIGRATAGCGAVLYAWYPGPTGGQAIADIVLGGREPVGRLPVSLPSGSGVLPVAYNERLEHTARYVDAPADAEFPFGAGLGYTTWSLGLPSTSDIALAGAVVRARLTNTGPRRGSQVVQLYARALVPGLVPRRAVLVGFTRITLDAGAATEVEVGPHRDARRGLVRPGDPAGRVELWLSITGAAERPTPLTLPLAGE